METYQFEKKIVELGGTKKSPTCQESNNLSIQKFESELNVNLPTIFKKFHEIYGAFSFNNSIHIQCKGLPISSEKECIKVDYFYCFDINCTNSILKIIEHQEGNLPKGYIPICDGEPGDLICLCVEEEEYGEVFYWWHESNMKQNLFKISSDFGDFISKLHVRKEVQNSQEELKNVKIKANQKLLDLLKKSGYGPKKTR
ncbi:MAG: SMI1/KNR4 family protein [Carboxylicivirga sp.]|jgi:hypothetical protein|nr:SMI1/KNR4 family protein [Carboxylicivirga sp.]